MKNLLVIFFIILTVTVMAQDTNKVVTDESSGKPMLVGYCNQDAFVDSDFSWWWKSEYNLYDVDKETISNLKNKIDEIDITIVLGTWCSDSKREVPRFFKILDELNYPVDKIKMICVDRNKEADVEELNELDINFVPTFIFYKGGEELGRIIEMPNESLEKDMAEFILE